MAAQTTIKRSQDCMALIQSLQSDIATSGSVAIAEEKLATLKQGGEELARKAEEKANHVEKLQETKLQKAEELQQMIGSIGRQEEAIQQRLSDLQASLSGKKAELRAMHSSLESQLRDAELKVQKAREDEKSRVGVGAVVGGLVGTILLPVVGTALGAAAGAGAGELLNQLIKDEEAARSIYYDRVQDCRERISRAESDIASVNREISHANNEISPLSAEKKNLQKQHMQYIYEAKLLKGMVVFFRRAFVFWKDVQQLSEHGTDRTALLQNIVSKAMKKEDFSCLGRKGVQMSFLDAWEETMYEEGAAVKVPVSRPFVITHPKDQILDQYGSEVILSIVTQDSDEYEWFKDGKIITADIYPYCRNYDSPNLVISPFMPEYEGNYKCRVSNKAGFVESIDAKIGVAVDAEVMALLCCGDVGNEGGTIEGAGIKISVPKDALPPGETSTVKIFASFNKPVLQSDLVLVSPLFRGTCSPYREALKEIEVTIEHFTTLETESDVDDLVFMVSKKGEAFHPVGQVTSEVKSSHGTVKVTHFCSFGLCRRMHRSRVVPSLEPVVKNDCHSSASLDHPPIMYSMLVALPKKKYCWGEDPVTAFFSVCVKNPAYIKMFEKYLKRYFKDHSFHPIDQTPIDSKSLKDKIKLTIPEESEDIQPSVRPPIILKTHVDSILSSDSNDNKTYPPRIRLDLSPYTCTKSVFTCYIKVEGIETIESFQLKAPITESIQRHPALKHNIHNASHNSRGASRGHVQDSEVYILHQNSHAQLLQQLSEHASEWREIGTHLGFRQGELNNIEHTPTHITGGPTRCLSAMLSEWLEWAPGDGRGSKQYATLSALKKAVSQARLGRTAENLCVS